LTSTGGEFNYGTLFTIMPDGSSYTKLLDFDDAVTGSNPRGSLVLLGGSLYGMAQAGGTVSLGTLFRYNLSACPVPIITTSSTELTASTGDSYQWFQNGIAVPEATTQSINYSALEYGVYKVEVTTNGCTATSSDFIYLITENEETPDQQFQVYPNPFSNNFFVNWKSNEPGELLLTDLLGRQNLSQPIRNGINDLDTHTLPNGIYIVTVRTGSKIYSIKTIKH
jgi:uncharacterized repeat protein (TIGR03803 family)